MKFWDLKLVASLRRIKYRKVPIFYSFKLKNSTHGMFKTGFVDKKDWCKRNKKKSLLSNYLNIATIKLSYFIHINIIYIHTYTCI